MGNSDGIWGKAKFSVPTDCFVCPVTVPTVTLGAVRSMLTTGSSVAKYMLVVPDSTMPVALFRSALLQSLWVQLAVNLLMSGKGEDEYFLPRAGL